MIARIIAAAALSLGAPVAATQNAAQIAITPTSERGAVIIRAPLLPIAPSLRTAYRLLWQVYDPVAQRMEGGIGGGNLTIAAMPKLFVAGFLVADLKPGTYALTSFSMQDWWGLCYQDASVQFTVKAGEIVYLGDFDAAGSATELMAKAVAAGRTSTRGSPVDFFDDVAPPRFTPADEAGLAAAAAMVKASMVATTVVPVAAALSPARFGTGSTLFGTRRCGGYFQVKAK